MIEDRARPSVSLLGGFELVSGGIAVVLPEGSQRLLAFLALQGRRVRRQTVAGTLWPSADEVRASSSLRSALTRLGAAVRPAVTTTALDLGISDDVTVDLWDAQVTAHRLLEASGASDDAEPGAEAIAALSMELLPDWYDDWALVEAEGWRQIRLHALEALADRLAARGDHAAATTAALAAVRAEPLRESPRAALIRVHISEGNPSEALREFARYGELLMIELGVEPTHRLRGLVADLWSTAPAG